MRDDDLFGESAEEIQPSDASQEDQRRRIDDEDPTHG
jgi:hypothetical protein